MKQRNLSSLLTVVFFFSSWLFSGTAPLPLPKISVTANHFVTQEGDICVFRGLDASDPDKLQRDGHWDKHYFEMIRSWGATIVRIPVHPFTWRLQGKEAYLQLLDQGIQWATEVGLYVILDWHSIGNLIEEKFLEPVQSTYPKSLYYTSKEETVDFWTSIAKRYKDSTTVAFFELFNEPACGTNVGFGNRSWKDWKKQTDSIVHAIRAQGATTTILVAGLDYGYDLQDVSLLPIEDRNVGYVSHPYPGKAKKPWDKNWTHSWGFLSEKYPLFLTEIGFMSEEAKGAHIPAIGDSSYGNAITSYCKEHDISYTIWCFDPDWTPSLIKDWTFEPTSSGLYFRTILQEK